MSKSNTADEINKTKKNIVSIIVPVYNSGKYLHECIESILKQTYHNIEVILVNDGSTDESLNICKEYKRMDKRINLINKNNSGVSDTRNEGIQNSNGAYISFIDSDDYIEETMIEEMVNCIEKKKTDLVVCNYKLDYSGKILEKSPRLTSGDYLVKDINGKLIDDGTLTGILFGSVCFCLYKRTIIDNNSIQFDPKIKINEDGFFNISYILNCTSLYALSNAYLYYYRMDTKNRTYTSNKIIHRFDIIEQRLRTDFDEKKIENFEKQLKRRNVSIALWNVLAIANKLNKDSLTKKIKMIKAICDDEKVKNGLGCIKISEINKFKKIYFYLIKHRLATLIYFITKYIYPSLERLFRR